MTNRTRNTAQSFLSILLVLLICELGGLSRIYGQSTREARFPKLNMQSTNVSQSATTSDSGPADFYDEYLKGKTVIIHLFYTTCDGGVCEAGTSKLAEVQKALDDRLGRDVFIYSITLKPNQDTPEKLLEYAEKFGAKPGWSFLYGSAEDVPSLRRTVGLAGRSVEVLRRLFPKKFAVGEKSVVARAPMNWEPRTLVALAGDDVVWKMDAVSPGEHGLSITNWNAVKEFVEVETVVGQASFNVTAGQNDAPTDTPEQVLLRLKIKAEPSVPTNIDYECTVHGREMTGEVSLGQEHSGMFFLYDDPTGSEDLIAISKSSGEIVDAINRLKGRVEQSVADETVEAIPALTIDAGPGKVWTSGGVSSNDLLVTAKKGQTIVFRQADPNLPHGLRFMNANLNLILLKNEDPTTKPDAVLKQTDDLGRYGMNRPKATNGPEDIAHFEVIKDITTAVSWQCTVHGPLPDGMQGRVEQTVAEVTVDAIPALTIDAGPGKVWTSGGVSSKDLLVTAKKGQTIVFRQADPNLPHGLRFMNANLNLILLKNEDPTTKPDAVLKQTDDLGRYGMNRPKATNGPEDIAHYEVIKDIITAVSWQCTVHGPLPNGMQGRVEQTVAEVTVDAIPALTIDAGPGKVWTSDGVSSNDLLVTAKKGQTIVFRQADPNLPHGLRFMNANLNLILLKNEDPTTKPDAVLKQTDDLGRYGMNRPKATNGPEDIAHFEVIKDITTAVSWQCTVHGPLPNGMQGRVEQTVASESAINGVIDIETIVATMPPNVQRRMLRFVNRAYAPADLMKSPQETRMMSEHMPPIAHKGRSVEGSTFDRDAAEMMLKQRPLDGYRDVRECLPFYKSAGGLDSMDSVLDSVGPRVFGKWDEVAVNVPPVMHAALLHTGKVLMLTNSTDSVIWNPAGNFDVLTGTATGLTDNLFCSGHSFLSDGRLLVVGGGGGSSGDALDHGWKFDPVTLRWSRTGNDLAFNDMVSKRWYPSLVTLGQKPERILVAAGLGPSGPAPRMEVYSEETDRFQVVSATGPLGNLRFPGTYPSLRVLPNGEILHVATGWGVSPDPCNQMPDGATVEPSALFTFTAPLTGSWRALGPNNRLKGMSVLLTDQNPPFIQSLVVGGGNASTSATAATMDLSTPTPTWSPAFSLLEARVHPNIVSLPDGTVFICGGKEASAPTPPDGGPCELFDPRPGAVALSEMDEMIRFRHYHSMAILLPDGRVMAAGGARRGGCSVSEQNTIEVFRPPYLFRGPQPLIESATGFVEHGGTIEIKTPSAGEIRRVVLARPMAVTHQTDSEQRILPLSFTATGPDNIEAVAPGGPGANPIAPAGYYMLFILDGDGVPSVAKWIYLGGTQVESLKGETSASKNESDDSTLVDQNGTKHSLREFAGRAHMLVLIKGAFCKHCTEQLAEFQKRIDPAKVPVIVITPENDLADLEDVPFTVLADTELSVFRKMNALGAEPLHGTFVFDSDGVLLLKEIGEEPFTDYDAIEKALSKVLTF